MRKLLAAAALGLAVLLTGCTDEHGADGAPGKVVDRDYDPSYKIGKVHHAADYDLTVERADGKGRYSIDVGSGAYDHCYTGSSYPKCVKR